MAGILDIGVSALLSFQNSLNTTGHNIANSDTESAWIGSLSRGSESGSYRPDTAETELAVLSTRAIQSLFNEVDIIFTETGPMVIENNPTPVFFADRDREKLESAVRRILESLVH